MPPHRRYLEPFLGAGVLLRPKRPALEKNLGVEAAADVGAALRDQAAAGALVMLCGDRSKLYARELRSWHLTIFGGMTHCGMALLPWTLRCPSSASAPPVRLRCSARSQQALIRIASMRGRTLRSQGFQPCWSQARMA